ncbi:MAG: hypothetical protein OEV00_08540 [Acidobacteriota bacterium]|nr:hypothetical protein [Acidobacteriota bacterium]MDH3785357.1 hypothetical protein [Acidobacteriota bacterium]
MRLGRYGLLALLLALAPLLGVGTVAGDDGKGLEVGTCDVESNEVVVQVINESSVTRMASVEVVALVQGKYVESRVVALKVSPYSDSDAMVSFSGVVDTVILAGAIEDMNPW